MMNWFYKDILYSYSIYDMLWLFIIYAFLGWCLEVVYAAFKTKKFINRGFLNGSVCPIYGGGALLVLVILDPVKEHPFLVFLLSSAVTTLIEFITGWILELIYKKKWWDYSNRKFNIKGYICLEFSVIWGLCCLFVYDIIEPGIIYPINHLPHNIMVWILLVIWTVFIVDIVISTVQATKFKNYITKINEISASYKKGSDALGGALASASLKLDQALTKAAQKSKWSTRRFLKAFPTIKDSKDKNIIKLLKEKIEKKKENKEDQE